eukprot:457466_1
MAEQTEAKKDDSIAKDERVRVIVTYEIKEDKLDEFIEIIKSMIIETNKQKGCIEYNLHSDKNNKCKFVMIEQWKSQSDLNQHLQQQYFKTYKETTKQKGIHKVPPSIFVCSGPVVKLD